MLSWLSECKLVCNLSRPHAPYELVSKALEEICGLMRVLIQASQEKHTMQSVSEGKTYVSFMCRSLSRLGLGHCAKGRSKYKMRYFPLRMVEIAVHGCWTVKKPIDSYQRKHIRQKQVKITRKYVPW